MENASEMAPASQFTVIDKFRAVLEANSEYMIIVGDKMDYAIRKYFTIRDCYLLHGDELIWLSCAYLEQMIAFTSTLNLRDMIQAREKLPIFVVSRLCDVLHVSISFFLNKFYIWVRMCQIRNNDPVMLGLTVLETSHSCAIASFDNFMRLFDIFFGLDVERDDFFDPTLHFKHEVDIVNCDNEVTTKNHVAHAIWYLFLCTKEYDVPVTDVKTCYHLLIHAFRFVFINIAHNYENLGGLLNVAGLDPDSSLDFVQCVTSKDIQSVDSLFVDLINLHTKLDDDLYIACYKSHFEPFLLRSRYICPLIMDYSKFKGALNHENIVPNVYSLSKFFITRRLIPFGIDDRKLIKLLYKNDVEQNVFCSVIDHQVRNKNKEVEKKIEPNDTTESVDQEGVEKSASPLKQLLFNCKNFEFDEKCRGLLAVLTRCCAENNVFANVNDIVCIYNQNFDEVLNSEVIITVYEYFLKKSLILESNFNSALSSLFDVPPTANTESSNTNEACLNNFVRAFVNDKKRCYSFVILICVMTRICNGHSCSVTKLCKILNLHPFYLLKYIDVVIRIEENLPRLLLKTLVAVDSSVVSYLGWQANSPVFESFFVDTENNTLRTSTYPPVCLPFFNTVRINKIFDYQELAVDRISLKLNDAKDFCDIRYIAPAMIHNSFNQQAKFNTELDVAVATGNRLNESIVLFYRKVYLLTFQKLSDMAIRLGLTRPVKTLAFNIFEHVIVLHPYILMDNHIDSMLLCSIVVACKITRENIVNIHGGEPDSSNIFEVLIKNYFEQPQALMSVVNDLNCNIIPALNFNGKNVTLSVNCTTDTNDSHNNKFRLSHVSCKGGKNSQNHPQENNNPVNMDMFYMFNRPATTNNKVNDAEKNLSFLLKENEAEQLKCMRGNLKQFYKYVFVPTVQPLVNFFIHQVYNRNMLILKPFMYYKLTSSVAPINVSNNINFLLSPLKSSRRRRSSNDVEIKMIPNHNNIENMSPFKLCKEMNTKKARVNHHPDCEGAAQRKLEL